MLRIISSSLRVVDLNLTPTQILFMKKKEVVTYFLGAGASANALPVVGNMHERMIFFYVTMRNAKDVWGPSDIPQFEHILQLINSSKQYGTPDTYAKILRFRNSPDYTTFKNFIALFILFEQTEFSEEDCRENKIEKYDYPSVASTFDPRYAQLIASVYDKLDESVFTEPKFNVISWNYDIQFEIMFGQILQLDHSRIMRYANGIDAPNEYSLITRLNGYCDFINSFGQYEYNSYDIKGFALLFQEVLFKPRTKWKGQFHFAWDQDENSFVAEHRKRAQKILSETTKLIVIGYSFPNFNRIVDKEMFRFFEGRTWLQGKDNVEEIANRLKECTVASSPENVTIVPYNDQFFVPEGMHA